MYKRVNELLGTNYRSDKEINWNYLSRFFKLSESFIREFKDYVDWGAISNYFHFLNEDFIGEFKDKVDWYGISFFQVLSESFIREFKDYVDWDNISICQVLSEDFIRDFKDEINWWEVSRFQLLSWDFILEFENKINWDFISAYQPFIDPDYEKINKSLLKQNELSLLYQKTKDKGWFIGYISSDDSYYSYFNLINHNKKEYKIKIYWKDLLTTGNKIKNFEIIRTMKYV